MKPLPAAGRYTTEARLLVAILALVVLFVVLYPDAFASRQNALNISQNAAILLVVALGQSFALLVGGFDISVGATMGLSATVGAMAMLEHGTVPGIIVGLAVATAVGLINGVLIARLRLSPFVATLGMLTLVTGFANHVSDGRSVFGLPASFAAFGREEWGAIPSAVGIAAIAGIVVWVVLNHTRTGLNIYAIGGGRDASLLAGVRVVRSEILAYTTCGFLAGLAGLMLASRVTVGQASLGQGYELLSIATAIIGGVAIGGGVGRISGVVLGVLLLAIITTGMNIAGLSEFIQQMLTGAVLIAAVLIDQLRGGGTGARLFGRRPTVAAQEKGAGDPAPVRVGTDAHALPVHQEPQGTREI